MGTVSLPWLANGQPMEVRPIPLNGQRELLEIGRRWAKSKAHIHNSYVLWFHQLVLETKRHLVANGVKAAKEAWDATRKANGLDYEELDWPEESFAARLHSYLTEHTMRQLDAATEVEARDEIKKRAADLNQQMAANPASLEDHEHESIMAEVYWCLLAIAPSELTPAGRKPIPVSWEPEDRAKTMEAIGMVASKQDRLAILAAHLGQGAKRRLDMADLEPTSEEAVLGKSHPASGSSTTGSDASLLFSTPTTATIAPSGDAATWSGLSIP
jgi:hypothetical protein